MKRKLNGADLARAAGGIDGRWIELAYNETELRRAAEESRSRPRRWLFGAELKKLVGVKTVWIFLLIFLALNFALAWRAAGRTAAARYPNGLVSRFFDGYFEKTEEYEARYAEIRAFAAQQNELFFQAMRAGRQDYEYEELPNRYSDDDAVKDSELFSLVYAALDQSEGYPARLEKVIDAAKANLSEFRRMGISEDSYAWKYQTEVIRRYEAMRGTVKIGVEYVRGWGDYFDYRLGDVLLFLLLILLCSVVFTQEKQAGFLPVLRASKRGRGKTATLKIALTLSVTLLFVLLFTLTSWTAFGLRIGFSSAENALQALPQFTYSPYRITVGNYFALTVLVKLFAASVFAALLVIPVNLFQRATVIPQTALIIVQLLPQRLGVINGTTVNPNLMPRHKHPLLVAAASLRTQPLGMKIVTHTIGSGLQNNHGLWLQNDAAAHTPHHIVRAMHHTRLPIGNLAQMSHRDVIAANSILAA